MTSRTTTRTRRTSGASAGAFTLLELLVVLAIIGIVAGVVAPLASGSLRGMRVRQAALTLAEHIRYAEALAIDRGRPARLLIDTAQQGYRLELGADALGLHFERAPGVSGEWIGLPEGVSFAGLEFSFAPDGMENVLLFEPDGQWSSGRVRLTDGTDGFQVRIKNTLGGVDVVPFAAGQQDPAETPHETMLESR